MQVRETGNDLGITEISNAAVLRAMANPTRLRILGLLRVLGPQTVGQISAKTGDAPGSISYHLSELEAAGLVDKQGALDGDRRKSWWRASDSATRPASSDADSSQAVDLFRRMAAITYERAYERYLDKLHTMDSEWVDAAMSADQVLMLTPNELEQMNAELQGVVRRWGAVNSESQADSEDKRHQVAVIIQTFAWVP